MHTEAYAWVQVHAPAEPGHVLDVGGRDVNGTTRGLFPAATSWTVLDVLPGPGVDIVADAAVWVPDRAYGTVVCTEVFEHAARWRDIVGTVFAALAPGGMFIATMAGPGRPVHSGVTGFSQLEPGEHYGNVDPAELADALDAAGFVDVKIDQRDSPADVRCIAYRPTTT